MKPHPYFLGSHGDTPLEVLPAEQEAGLGGGLVCPDASLRASAMFASLSKWNQRCLSDFTQTKRQNGTNFGLMIKTDCVSTKAKGQKTEHREHQSSYFY